MEMRRILERVTGFKLYHIFLIWIVNGVTALPGSMFRRSCVEDCEQSLLPLPLGGKQLTDCDWACRVKDCQFGCRAIDYSLGSNASDACFGQCASANRSSACESGCVAGNVQMVNYIAKVAWSARLLSSQAPSWDKITASWRVDDACLDAGVTWKVQVRKVEAPCDDRCHTSSSLYPPLAQIGWMVAAATIGVTGNTVLEAAINGGVVAPNSTLEVRLAAALRSRLVAFSSSTVVNTPPAASPPDTPILATIETSDESKIDRIVCWKTSESSLVTNHSVTLSSSTSPIDTETQIVASDCVVLRDLGSGDWRVSVTAQNDFGTSDAASVVLAVPSEEKSLPISQLNTRSLFYCNRTHIFKSSNKDDYLLSQQLLLYKTQSTATITAMTANATAVHSVLSNGDVIEVQTDQSGTDASVIFHIPNRADRITAMSVDWLMGDIYFAAADQIILCRAATTNCYEYNVTIGSAPIVGLAVEPRLGYLYYTTSNGLYSLPLNNSAGGALPTQLLDFGRTEAGFKPALALDGNRSFMLYIATNSTIYAFDAVTSSLTETRNSQVREGTKRDHANVLELTVYDGDYYWISRPCAGEAEEYCMLGEEEVPSQDGTDVQIQRFTLAPGHGPLVGLAVQTDYLLPIITPPAAVNALFSDEAVRVTWSEPSRLPFQALSLDIPFHYVLSLRLDGQVVSSSQANHSGRTFAFQPILPLKLYVIGVTTCWGQHCSTEAVTWGKSMASGDLLKSVDLVVARSDNRSGTVDSYDMLGNPLSSYGSSPSNTVVRALSPLSAYGDYLALDSANCLYNIDSSGKWTRTPFPPCGQPDSTLSCFRYEPLAGSVYYCDGTGVYRSPLGATTLERISSETNVRSLSLLSSKALAVVHRPDGVYGIQLTGAFYSQYYSCPSTDCEVLAVCTVDGFHDSRVYILTVFYSIPKMELRSALLDNSNQEIVGQTNATLPVKSMEYYFGKFIFLLHDGRLAVADADLQIFSYFQVADVGAFTFYAPGSAQDALPAMNVQSADVASTKLGAMMFTWSTGSTSSSTHELRPVYYNVTVSSGTKVGGTITYLSTVIDQPFLQTDLVPANENVQMSIVPFDHWRSGTPFVHRLSTPSAPPSVPRNPRLRVDYAQSPYNTSARVTLLWDEPRWNGLPMRYNATCWTSSKTIVYLVEDGAKKKNEQREQSEPERRAIAEVEVDPQQQYLIMDYLPIGVVVGCQVAAATTNATGRPTEIVEIDTSTRSPSSLLLVARNDALLLVDAAADAVVGRLATTGFTAAGALGNDLFGIGDNKLAIIAANSLPNIQQLVTGLNGTAQLRSLVVDHIGRNLYISGSELNSFGKGGTIWKYNLDTKKPMKSIYSVSTGVSIARMAVDSLENTLYCTTYDGSRHQLLRLQLTSLELHSGSPECQLVSPALAVAGPGTDGEANSTLAAYVITEQGIVDAATCQPILNDTTNVTWGSVDEMVFLQDNVIIRVKKQLFNVHRRTGFATELTSSNGIINGIQSFSVEQQPLPDISCLKTPLETLTDFRVYPINKTAAQVDIEDSLSVEPPGTSCPTGMALPEHRYVVRICQLTSSAEHEETDCKRYDTYEKSIQIEGLSRLVQYDVHVDKANFYSDDSDANDSHSQIFNTSQEIRLAPAKLQLRTITADKVLLTWERPPVRLPQWDSLKYKVTVLSMSKVKLHEEEDIECPSNPCQYLASGLKPNSTYVFRVGPSGDKRPSEIEMNNNEASAVTFQSPGILLAIGSNFTFDSLFLLWQPSLDARLTNWAVQYARVAEESWREVSIDEERYKQGGIYPIRISKLRPLTQYKVRLFVLYDSGYNYTEEYTYITNGRRRPRSPGTVPDAPINFHIEEKEGKRYFMWEEPDEGGSRIDNYSLQYRDSPKGEWAMISNNVPPSPTEYPFYRTVKTTPTTEFRLAAVNSAGIGKWAVTSVPPTQDPPKRTIAIIVAVCVVAVLVLVAVTVLLACRRRICGRRREPRKEVFDTMGRPLPGYQGRDGSSHLDALAQISKDDLEALPHVSRNCITASRPLGQGAFGEVYEGLACNLPRIGPKSVRVAIKTLKEGSADVERVKFLKEAILMSKFRHPNIVQLLGVCLESEPHWIILELMEGGDLLTYLRVSRPTESMPSQVALEDLITLAIDVSRGCSHLEQHHHVHRDLAARNCLVSSRDPAQRVVKIADFGMARDVYEGDYYRVEGHGLLPVRWMAPESMIDGVFTTKTDVWSFGVLLWEIMTLGQQPYPGRTNWDVMNYVRIGGRLKSPEFCPAEVYDVMNACWVFESKERPTFTDLTHRLESLRALPRFQSDIPFPPFYPKTSLPTDSKENSATQSPAAVPPQPQEGQPQLFVTQASGKFQRNTKQGHSQPGRSHKLQKAAELLSFRKQKESQPARPPPSKDEIDAGRSPSSLATTPDTRPTSSESFTTSTEGYEVPLLKNLNAAAGGFVNRAYEPTTPTALSAASIPGSEHKQASSGNPSSGRPASPAGAGQSGSARIKPNAPKPPLKPDLLHSSPRSTPRKGSPSPSLPSSYENVPLD